MPLDGRSYLVSQGWTGEGTGLRKDAISRPLTIPQKRTLAGLGKDRDEAFPFWDHLFTAAAKSIQVKLHEDDDTSDTGDDTIDTANLKRTSTGLLSNRRPALGTPASSGTATPDSEPSNADRPRFSLLTTAKREAAKRGLYARFLRGPVLGPDVVENGTSCSGSSQSAGKIGENHPYNPSSTTDVAVPDRIKSKKKRRHEVEDSADIELKKKKNRKRDEDKKEKEQKKMMGARRMELEIPTGSLEDGSTRRITESMSADQSSVKETKKTKKREQRADEDERAKRKQRRKEKDMVRFARYLEANPSITVQDQPTPSTTTVQHSHYGDDVPTKRKRKRDGLDDADKTRRKEEQRRRRRDAEKQGNS